MVNPESFWTNLETMEPPEYSSPPDGFVDHRDGKILVASLWPDLAKQSDSDATIIFSEAIPMAVMIQFQ